MVSERSVNCRAVQSAHDISCALLRQVEEDVMHHAAAWCFVCKMHSRARGGCMRTEYILGALSFPLQSGFCSQKACRLLLVLLLPAHRAGSGRMAQICAQSGAPCPLSCPPFNGVPLARGKGKREGGQGGREKGKGERRAKTKNDSFLNDRVLKSAHKKSPSVLGVRLHRWAVKCVKSSCNHREH